MGGDHDVYSTSTFALQIENLVFSVSNMQGSASSQMGTDVDTFRRTFQESWQITNFQCELLLCQIGELHGKDGLLIISFDSTLTPTNTSRFIFQSLVRYTSQYRRRPAVIYVPVLHGNHFWSYMWIPNQNVVFQIDSLLKHKSKKHPLCQAILAIASLIYDRTPNVEVAPVPQQTNYVDCGPYCIYFGASIGWALARNADLQAFTSQIACDAKTGKTLRSIVVEQVTRRTDLKGKSYIILQTLINPTINQTFRLVQCVCLQMLPI